MLRGQEGDASGWYRVKLNTIAREGSDLSSPMVKVITMNTLVHAIRQDGRRVQIDAPISGWMSLRTEAKGGEEVEIMRREDNATEDEKQFARASTISLPNGSMDATQIVGAVQQAQQKQIEATGQALADKALQGTVSGEKKLAHAVYGMDEGKVASAGGHLQGVERSAEASMQQAAATAQQVLSTGGGGGGAKAVVQNAELAMANAASKEASARLNTDVKLPENLQGNAEMPKELAKDIKVPSSKQIHEALENGPKNLGKEVGSLFR